MSNAVDPRHISNGWEIPTEHYSDQPYIVKTDDGAWLCVLTTGAGTEGASGQHVVTLRSTDGGRTWSKQVDVEPADGPEASYAVLLKAPDGRIFCFYNHNTDNLRQVIADDPPFKGGFCTRVDSLGYFVFKISEDGGRTWSAKRTPIPMREMDIDRRNAYGGKVRFFWNVGKPFILKGAAYVSCHKVGGFGEGFFTRSEGVLLKSDNLLTEHDPAKVTWETLPEGDFGLRTSPGGGPIAEEQSYSVLSDGSIYCVYRSIDGHPVEAYSRDGARTWSTSRYKAYADGRLMKHPRAANFAWRCSNGRYLYWYHNHGGNWYEDRNPVWLSGGVEADSPEGKVILWSQPEIVLYDDDTYVRMSYPDLVEEDGEYYLTETQKDIARVHLVDRALVEGLWGQFEAGQVARDGQALELPAGGAAMPSEAPMPKLRDFMARDNSRADYGTKDLRAGFSLDLRVRLEGDGRRETGDGSGVQPGQIVLDSRAPDGHGLCLQTTARGTLEILLNDGRTENRWDCDPGVLQPGKLHHVVVTVDGGPKVITFVVDGKLCDGGEHRQFGWGRFSPHLRDVNGGKALRIGHGVAGLRVYSRALRTSEGIGSLKAGR